MLYTTYHFIYLSTGFQTKSVKIIIFQFKLKFSSIKTCYSLGEYSHKKIGICTSPIFSKPFLTDRRTDRRLDRQRDRQMDGQGVRQTDGQTERQMYRQNNLRSDIFNKATKICIFFNPEKMTNFAQHSVYILLLYIPLSIYLSI